MFTLLEQTLHCVHANLRCCQTLHDCVAIAGVERIISGKMRLRLTRRLAWNEVRTAVEITVCIRGMDANGRLYNELATTADMTTTGARA
jgi:hypothetical protein